MFDAPISIICSYEHIINTKTVLYRAGIEAVGFRRFSSVKMGSTDNTSGQITLGGFGFEREDDPAETLRVSSRCAPADADIRLPSFAKNYK